MGRHVAGECPEMDRLVDEAIAGVGADVSALRIPKLRGVVLGGGYGRGEGGVARAPGGGPCLYNDLDFYVVSEDGSDDGDAAAIAAALSPVSARWSARLGVDVDFSPAKTSWRIRHDQDRLMVQELLRGYFDVAGERGESLFAGVARRGPDELPWMEAARLMMNRGVGLLLAYERARGGDGGEDGEDGFVARNINKCVLGAGDARLIARGRYRWRAEERAEALCDGLYRAAVEWKFRPGPAAVCGWDEARDTWLGALEELALSRHSSSSRASAAFCEPARSRTLYSAVRWIARRRTLGELASFGLDPVVRVLRRVARSVRERRALTASLRRDWEVFN